MLRLRLVRIGKKHFPSYRIVVMENKKKRNGQIIADVGYYNPISKKLKCNKMQIKKWLASGVKPTNTTYTLLKIANLIFDN